MRRRARSLLALVPAVLAAAACAGDGDAGGDASPDPQAQPAGESVEVTVDLELTVVPVEGGAVGYAFVDAETGEEVATGPIDVQPRQTFTAELPPGTYTLEIHSAVDIGDGTSGAGDDISRMPCDPDIDVAGTALEVVATAGTQCAVEATEIEA